MGFTWLKRYMPRSLYWRAALIIMLPFLALQLVVSVVFIQRHFEDVTQQMIANLEPDLRMVLQATANSQSQKPPEALLELGIRVMPIDTQHAQIPTRDGRVWYDLSGGFVIASLREMFAVARVDLRDRSRVVLWLVHDGQDWQVSFDRKRASARNPHQLLVLMVFTGLVMIVIAFLFLRNQLRPIKRLATAAEEFGRGRSIQYSPSGANEVRSAGNAFLDMRNRIERHIEQRTMLLSGVSHDLRTPLTRLKLGLEMMGEGPEVADLRRDVDEMRGMLDTFLDYSREGTGEAAVPTDLSALLEQAVEDARRGGMDVQLTGAEGPVMVSLRPGGVRRAIDNLLGNAGRYGSETLVRLDVMDRSVRISIEDNGAGIPEEQREEAMKPFARLDKARNQNEGGGVGLGLAIAADIARVHGGTLRLGRSGKLGGLQADLVFAR